MLINFLFRAAPEAYGGSQARGGIRATAASLHHSHSHMGSKPYLWPTAYGHAWSLTHGVRPGIKPSSSRMLVGFITAEPHWELPGFPFSEGFQFPAKRSGNDRVSITPRHATPPTPPPPEVHLLQPMKLRWHVIVTQSPQLTGGFILGVAPPWVQTDRWRQWHGPPCAIRQSGLAAPGILSALLFTPLLLAPGNHWSLYCSHGFVFSRMS